MKILDLFRRQFLLTTQEGFNLPWKSETIANYNLYYHPDLEFEHISNSTKDIYLLGFLYDYENPENSNKQILESLFQEHSFNDFLDHLAIYSGHFVIIYKTFYNFYILNDAAGQNEIYYDTSFSSFGTQPKLIGKVIPLSKHSSFEAEKFYSSSIFLKRKLFIGESTYVENIMHLLPNHFIDISLKSKTRYFPRYQIKPISIEQAAIKVQNMLKGYIKAASIRNKLYIGVTGGYDSRVLFLASLDIECKYYVTKLPEMDTNHYDIYIPKKLTKIFNKGLEVIIERESDYKQTKKILDTCIDFPRDIRKHNKEFENNFIINGNISEICRHSNNYFQKISPEDLAYLYGYSDNNFVIKEYRKWIENNSNKILDHGYNLIDVFYWEEKMGNWAAKEKTTMGVLGTVVYSPFCSHKLLSILLSTPLKDRDPINNNLYNLIIKNFSIQASKIPVNPSLKNKIKLILKKAGLYNIYLKIGIKLRIIGTYSS